MGKIQSKFIKGKEYLLHPLTSFYEPLVQGVYNNLKEDTTGRNKHLGKLEGTVKRINIRSFKAGHFVDDFILITRRELAWLVTEYEIDAVVF